MEFPPLYLTLIPKPIRLPASLPHSRCSSAACGNPGNSVLHPPCPGAQTHPTPKNTPRTLPGAERGLEIPKNAPEIAHIIRFKAGDKLRFQTRSVCSGSAGSGVIKSTFPVGQTELQVIKAASPPRLGLFWVTHPSTCPSSSHRELGGAENPWIGGKMGMF